MIFLLLSGFLNTVSASSALTPKVDSFTYTGRYTSTAELCGHVEGGVQAMQQIMIVVDPKSKAPVKYVALTTPQGEFCAVVSTISGLAEVSLVGMSMTPTRVEIGNQRQQ